MSTESILCLRYFENDDRKHTVAGFQNPERKHNCCDVFKMSTEWRNFQNVARQHNFCMISNSRLKYVLQVFQNADLNDNCLCVFPWSPTSASVGRFGSADTVWRGAPPPPRALRATSRRSVDRGGSRWHAPTAARQQRLATGSWRRVIQPGGVSRPGIL